MLVDSKIGNARYSVITDKVDYCYLFVEVDNYGVCQGRNQNKVRRGVKNQLVR